MFGVGDSNRDDILKEDFEDTTGLLVDQARDTLDTTTMHQTVDSGLATRPDTAPKVLLPPSHPTFKWGRTEAVSQRSVAAGSRDVAQAPPAARFPIDA